MASNKNADGFVSLYGVTVKSNINLVIEDYSKNDCYIQALKEILNSRDIKYKI